MLWADYLEDSAQVNRFQWTPWPDFPIDIRLAELKKKMLLPDLAVSAKLSKPTGQRKLFKNNKLDFYSNEY